jgi:hypothetical protein
MANPSGAGQWYNADGLLVKFPQYQTIPANFINRSRAYNSGGDPVRKISYYFDLTKLATGGIAFTTDINNDGIVDGFNAGDVYIPAGSAITNVKGIVMTPLAGGTSLAFDVYEIDGSNTTITNHSIYTATAGATANWSVAGEVVTPDGVLPYNSTNYVGADSIPTTRDGFLAVKATGTFTAGTGLILIEYVPTMADVSTTEVGA